MACPACGRINSSKTGVPFPTDSSKYVRYCLQLQISPKDVDRSKSLICFEHFDPKELVKEGNRIIGVTRLAIPKKVQKTTLIDTRPNTQITLDQVLAQNLGIGITQSSSAPPQCQTIPMSTQSVNFNFQNQTTRPIDSSPSLNQQTYEMGIFGFPRNSNVQQFTDRNDVQSRYYSSQSSSHLSKLEFLTGLIRRTLVLYRYKKSGSSPAIDQKYFKEWILTSFNLPEKAISEISQVSNVKNLYVIYIILDEKPTLDSVLQMYHSASSHSYQCVLTSGTEVLQEGALILKRKSCNSAVLEKPSFEECFRLLLQLEVEHNAEYNSDNGVPKSPAQIDESVWRNIAAEIIPAYRNMIAATTTANSAQTSFQATNLMNFSGVLPQIPSSIAGAKQPRNTPSQ